MEVCAFQFECQSFLQKIGRPCSGYVWKIALHWLKRAPNLPKRSAPASTQRWFIKGYWQQNSSSFYNVNFWNILSMYQHQNLMNEKLYCSRDCNLSKIGDSRIFASDFFHFDLSHFRYLLRPKYEPQQPQWGLKF